MVWFVSLTIVNWGDKFLPANVFQLVQDIMPGEKMMFPEMEKDEDFVDPREMQQVLREIKDIRRELNRFAKQFKKIANSENEMNQANVLLGQIQNWENLIKSGNNVRDNIQEFRDEQIWETVNQLRAKVEIPKELTQWQREIKRVATLLKQKKIQNLGFDLNRAQTKLDETKSALARVQEFYNGGNLQDAIDEFDNLRQDFHPGEIMSVLQRMQEVNGKIKMVKDAAIQTQIKESLSEVIGNFNEGEYRFARELMDESHQDIMNTIYKIYWMSKQKGFSQDDISAMTEKLGEQLQEKSEQKKSGMPFMPEQKIMMQVQPEAPTPVQPAPQSVSPEKQIMPETVQPTPTQ